MYGPALAFNACKGIGIPRSSVQIEAPRKHEPLRYGNWRSFGSLPLHLVKR